jgi:hypothetical protein
MLLLLQALLAVCATIRGAVAGGVGVTYGTRGTTLPAAADVARFLARDTIVGRVRLLDADPVLLRALAGTGLAVDVTVPNGVVPRLRSPAFARRWVRDNVAPYYPNVSRVLVGNEANRTLLLSLAPAVRNLHAGRFRDDDDTIGPLLRFLRALHGERVPLLLARLQRHARLGAGSGLRYANMLDAQLDAVHSAMRRAGFGDVDIVVAVGRGGLGGGRGPRQGVQHEGHPAPRLRRGHPTPLMPNRTFEVSIFDENLKPGPVSERNFGRHALDCDFGETGLATRVDPSKIFPSTAPSSRTFLNYSNSFVQLSIPTKRMCM